MTHKLDYHDTLVGVSCRVKAVNRLSGNIDCRVESEGHVCPPDIIINSLGYPDYVQPLICKQVSSLQGSVSPDTNKAIKTHLLIMFFYKVWLLHFVFAFAAVFKWFFT